MGHCPCFGFMRGKKLKTDQDGLVYKKCRPSEHRIPQLSPEPGVESSASAPEEESSGEGNKAQTFTYRELATATRNFRSESFIGQGGFGAVYKGRLRNSSQVVAVKQLNKTGFQGDKEFLVEVLMLSLLHHPNLVNLIGYCAEGDQRLLVYEYMPLGSLEHHLYDLPPDKEPLDWNTRMIIASGAAKGLEYLHHVADPPVIFRDLKPSNILLDEGFHPKLSDFGLAKFGPSDDKSHVSTRVMGTHGYCAPEYASTGKLTTKSDIYSFGIVLLELITGRKALDNTRLTDKRLIDWAMPLMRDRKDYVKMADPSLRGEFSESILRKAVDVASMCVRENPNARPTMKEVVLAMNYLTSHMVSKSKSSHRKNVSEEENSPKENTKMIDIVLEREQAVAEAKMWGETWRDAMTKCTD